MGDDDVTDNVEEKFKGIMNFLKVSGSNGVLLNKILVWVDIQSSMTTSDTWIHQAKAKFLPEEIMQAKAQFYQCAKDSGNEGITGKYVAHKKGNNPVEQNLKELALAMKKLGDAEKSPLILGSSQMIRSLPAYSVDDSNMGVCDVMERVKTLENTLGIFMTSQNNKFDKLTEMVGTVGQGSGSSSTTPPATVTKPPPGPVRDILSTSQSRDRLESVSKKRKVEESDDTTPEIEEEVFELTNVSSGEKWTRVVKKGKKKEKVTDENETPPARRESLPKRQQGAWRKPLIIGSARANNEGENKIESADVTLVAAGLSKEATASQLETFVNSKGLRVTSCTLLTDHEKNPDARSNTFKVTIKADDYDKALDEKMWPYRVRVRLFKHFRKKQEDTQKKQMEELSGSGQSV